MVKIGFGFALLSLVIFGVILNLALYNKNKEKQENKNELEELLFVQNDFDKLNQVSLKLSDSKIDSSIIQNIEKDLLAVEINISSRMNNIDTNQKAELLKQERELLSYYWIEVGKIQKGTEDVNDRKQINASAVKLNNTLDKLINTYK